MLSRRQPRRPNQFRSKCAADRIPTERQRQACHLLPPSSEIDDAVQTRLVVGQLAFMNDQPGFVLAFQYLRDDLVERNDFGFNSRREKLQARGRPW